MDFAFDEPKAILSKSVLMLERMIDRLEQVDESQFPTTSSEEASDLLVGLLKALQEPANLAPMAPAVLYNKLFAMEALADKICRSSTDRISWPLVSYCDDIWNRLFGMDGPSLFYSLTSVHNYTVFRFSDHIGSHLDGVLPKSRIEKLTQGRKVYCLELPSSEDANLPLYANIGHEFGHAVFDHHRAEVVPRLAEAIRPLFTIIIEELKKHGDSQSSQRFRHVPTILKKFGTEIFCDIVGAHLMGPAFFLSLFEMSWGESDRSAWAISLSPDENATRAYPSFPFRLGLIRRWADVESFCSIATDGLSDLHTSPTTDITSTLVHSPTDHSADTIRIQPRRDDDAMAISDAMNRHLADLKSALDRFASDCDALVKQWYPEPTPSVKPAEVVELLRRLERHILPNIVPNDSLLGKCAPFPAILIASALFRLQLLTRKDSGTVAREADIVERLTAKALEVTYVHCEYEKSPLGNRGVMG